MRRNIYRDSNAPYPHLWTARSRVRSLHNPTEPPPFLPCPGSTSPIGASFHSWRSQHQDRSDPEKKNETFIYHEKRKERETYAHKDVHTDRGRKDSRATPRRDFADVAHNLHRFAALGEGSDNTLLRLEESSVVIILYMKENYS